MNIIDQQLRASTLTPPPREEPSIVISVSVCLYLYVCPHAISGTTPSYQNLAKFSVHTAYGPYSVLLWRRCDALCTSGFVNFIFNIS